MNKHPKVIASLPNAGLGNCLFVWAKATVYAEINQLSIYTVGWNKFHIGPWLRGERVKRSYNNYFQQKSSVRIWFITKIGIYLSNKILLNPVVTIEVLRNTNYIIFSTLPHWSDYFQGIKEHRSLVKTALFKNLSSNIHSILSKQTNPEIGVHVRLGDFRELEVGEDFAKIGLVRTPFEYFKMVIEEIRNLHYEDMAVTLFSDGHPHELSPLLKMPNIKLAPVNPDIVDLIQLSKSKIIITSASSTFSAWAGFLSNAALIIHPDHVHQPVRKMNTYQALFEGTINDYKDFINSKNRIK